MTTDGVRIGVVGTGTVRDEIRCLVRPFALGDYVEDWNTRASRLSAMSDVWTFLARENGHWSLDTPVGDLHPLSLPPVRRSAIDASVTFGPGHGSQLAFAIPTLEGRDREILSEAAAGLDSAEKIVISAASRALHDLDGPPELALDLMNIVYEEALHLDAIGRLLGLDHAASPWIPEDRATNWQLVRQCETSLEYMVLEHCFYEGRGTVASAAGAHYLERAGVSRQVVAVMDAIAKQEAGHNISGFRWLKLLGNNRDENDHRLAALVRKFVAGEPLPHADGSSRSVRKHFPLYLFQQFRGSGDFLHLKREIVAASRVARQTGSPGVPIDDIYEAADQVLAWCETS